MATERSFGSVTLSSRKNVTRPSTRSASFGLWSSMLKGPRTPPKTFTTASTTACCSAGTSDLPLTGVSRGMGALPFSTSSWAGSRQPSEEWHRFVDIARRALHNPAAKGASHGTPRLLPPLALHARCRAGFGAGAGAARRTDDSLRTDRVVWAPDGGRAP